MIYLLLAINIILLASGQVLWKLGMGTIEEFSIIRIIFNPYIFAGIIIYGIATFVWLYILGKAELSLVYPLQSITYILGTILATVVFHENVSPLRWIGVMIIFCGAFLVAKG